MTDKDLVQLLNNDIDNSFSETMSMEEVREKLKDQINALILGDFPKLVAILYKIDVDEDNLKRVLKEHPGIDSGEIIADLILDRELQKALTRKDFKSGKKSQKGD